jgi:hypothetical protein
MAGMTIRVSKVEETIPPIVGRAIRCITSDPVPLLPKDRDETRHDGDDGHHFRPHPSRRAEIDRLIEVDARERAGGGFPFPSNLIQCLVERCGFPTTLLTVIVATRKDGASDKGAR